MNNNQKTLTKKNHILLIQRHIALIDELLSKQVNMILHHKRFQQLESSWRGLYYLVNQATGTDVQKLKIRILDISWKALSKDLSRAIEFDQSELFNKIYNREFGHPGGEPFGILIGDYYITHKLHKNVATQDIRTLQSLSKVAAAAFAPFITSVEPAIFGLDSFADLHSSLNLNNIFQQAEYFEWKQFRNNEDARFIGLVLPHTLMRLPHEQAEQTKKFCFQETVNALNDYLWGNAAYCFAAVTIRAFNQSGWLADIRGVEQDKISGGLVLDLPRHSFSTDKQDLICKYATDVCITDKQEKILSDLGFISLCECKYMELAAFYGCQSMQISKSFEHTSAANNAKLATMLQYMLCVSRFAHYIKVLVRDKVGSFINAEECERYLENWLMQYTAAGEDLTTDIKAKYPLREARIQVQDRPEKPGCYLCFIHLRPHYQLDQLQSQLHLITELVIGK